MFGIVFLIFVAICTLISWIIKAKQDYDDVVISKKIAEEDGSGRRLCGDNRTWCDLKTGQHYRVEKNLLTGDMEKISTTGKVLENLTETKRQQFKADKIARSGDSKYYVESVWFNNDELYPNRRRRTEQSSNKATRVINKETGVDYFCTRRGDMRFYQDLDTGRYIDYELKQEAKGKDEIMVPTENGIRRVKNTQENREKTFEFMKKDLANRIEREQKFWRTWDNTLRNGSIWS